MAGLITGMQLAQATGLRHTLELARTRWPEATGAIYYKLTDVYPACAWSTVDWYGVPKIAYWAVQDAFAPLHACALFEKLSVPAGEGLALPIYLLDDAARLRGPWKVSARAYDGALAEVARRKFAGSGAVGRVRRLGELAVAPERAGAVPLLVVVEVRQAGGVADRTWYWLNYAARPGCLFTLPRTELQVSRRPGAVVVRNVGRVPAVGVQVVSGQPERLRVEDGYFWLDPGEQRRLAVQGDQAGLAVAAWNASAPSDKGGQR
jgi:beta-mannosidase